MTENSKNIKLPELFFHVGLSKTGSTYLQNRFFHKLQGIKYIHTSKYFGFPKIINQSTEQKLLFSREFDRQFESETIKIAQNYPDAKIIIVLRSNEQWIASQYRRYVKNGGSKEIEGFIDINSDSGVWKIKDAAFMSKLDFLIEYFQEKPLILFYDDLKKNPHAFFSKIAEYTDTTYLKEQISLNPKHKSYTDKQLLFVRNITSRFYKKDPNEFTTGEISWFRYRSRWLLLHLVLYFAKLIPGKETSKLISKESLVNFKTYYQTDWNNCMEFAKKHSA